MDKQTPRYKSRPAPEDLPKAAAAPELKICQLVNGDKLVLPKDIRQMFMSDPIWGVQQVAGTTTQPANQGMTKTENGGNGTPKAKDEVKEEDFDWAGAFPDALTVWRRSRRSMEARTSLRSELFIGAGAWAPLVPVGQGNHPDQNE